MITTTITTHEPVKLGELRRGDLFRWHDHVCIVLSGQGLSQVMVIQNLTTGQTDFVQDGAALVDRLELTAISARLK
jgi:hypothetical protein